MLTKDVGVIRSGAAAEERWFYGGGVHRWLVRAAETDGAYFLYEDLLEIGKVTPLHTHPAEETLIVLEGAIVMHIDGEDQPVDAGGVAVARRGVPHAFKVVADHTRLLCLHTPGTCEDFYLHASTPLAEAERATDFDRVRDAAAATGSMHIVGPPPFEH